MIVLDASALLAFLFQEAGHEQVGAEIEDSCLSTVNLSEVIGRFVRDGHDARVVLQRLVSSNIDIVSFSPTHAGLAASLVPATQPLGLSLGDRACLALALNRDLPALTADRAWAELDVGVNVRVIR